jgi:hypothetical protein
MAQPTESQLHFVSDVESGVRALIAQGTQISKISHVMEAAGREAQELSQFVGRFAELGHWQLIQRLADAFHQVNIAPLSIARAMDSMPKKAIGINSPNTISEPLELERHLPVESIGSKALEVQFEPEGMESRYCTTIPEPEELLCDVIKMISQLPQPLQRKKVAGMAANWFGVGG